MAPRGDFTQKKMFLASFMDNGKDAEGTLAR